MSDTSAEIHASKRSIGRHASSPVGMPRRGWWQIVKRVARRFGEDNLSLVSAGVAFYALLGLFLGSSICARTTLIRSSRIGVLAERVLRRLEEARGTIDNPWTCERAATPTVAGIRSEVRRA